MSRRIALITGATSGIGEATAKLLSTNGFDLILTGRREERLQSLKSELGKNARVITLNFDVRDQAEVKNKLASLPAEWKAIDVLVNNAGNAHGLDPIQRGSLEDWDAMIDINVKGLLYVSREVIPLMINRKHGHIVNIGSIAGKEVYPNGNVYCASKFAVDALTKGMRMDLNSHSIKVTSINPGLVETEFSLVRFKGDAPKASQVYKGLDPLKAEDIADIILYTLNAPSHVVLADITVLPTAQASAAIVKRTE
jgi:3-hydroxy acid dehydrogenase / malonic semialdehyde reductase